MKVVTRSVGDSSAPKSVFSSRICAESMERLWSLAVATSGNRWQIGRPRIRRNQAKPVATGCDQLPWDLDGKSEVDGLFPPAAECPLLEREEVDSGDASELGDRDVVAAADCPAFDDVGVDA